MPSVGDWRRAIALLMLLSAWSVPARPQGSSEPALKAGFVYNFAKFTEWPPGAIAGPQMTVCLIGADPLGAVSALLDGHSLQGRTVAVRRQVRGDDVKTCTILFITDVDDRRQAEALRAVRGLPVLTIGDADGFVDDGGQIGLVSADNRIQFEVNLEAAQHAGLRINSQLLRLARSVKGKVQ